MVTLSGFAMPEKAPAATEVMPRFCMSMVAPPAKSAQLVSTPSVITQPVQTAAEEQAVQPAIADEQVAGVFKLR